MKNDIVNIFWTGGWDSTFRILYLLIVEKRAVQPYFVVRYQDSVGDEIKTMNDIRRQLFRDYPSIQNLLNPTKYIDIREIKSDKKINDNYRAIKDQVYIAAQYKFLACFCKQYNMQGIELGLIKRGSVTTLLETYFTDFENGSVKINPPENHRGLEKNLYELFRYYELPLTDYTKIDMRNYAKRKGFLNLLNMTWFCATPKGGKPCGFCGPCLDAIKMNLPGRIPFFRRQLSRLHLPFRNFYRKKFKKYKSF